MHQNRSSHNNSNQRKGRALLLRRSEVEIKHMGESSLSVDLPEHNVLRADDGHHVGYHVSLAHHIQSGLYGAVSVCRATTRDANQMGESGGLDLAAVGLAGAVGNKIHAKLALARFTKAATVPDYQPWGPRRQCRSIQREHCIPRCTA